VRSGELEHLTDKSGRRPVRHRDETAGTTNAFELRRGQFRPRSKHGAKHRDYRIKTRVVVRQVLSVAFVELDH
jgi:hypothetical protein